MIYCPEWEVQEEEPTVHVDVEQKRPSRKGQGTLEAVCLISARTEKTSYQLETRCIQPLTCKVSSAPRPRWYDMLLGILDTC